MLHHGSAKESHPSSPDSLDGSSDEDSIFGSSSNDAGSDADSLLADEMPASTSCPAIPGLFIFPALLEETVAEDLLDALAIHDTFTTTRNQVMFFTRPPPHPCSLPTYLTQLEFHLASLLHPLLPAEVHSTVFTSTTPLARQIILNTYAPGEGISSHIDLVERYADGIVGVSLEGGVVMQFSHVEGEQRHDVWLPPYTVYVLSGEARWEWEHGILGRHADLVCIHGDERDAESIPRTQRTSITMRWMKPGADELR